MSKVEWEKAESRMQVLCQKKEEIRKK